MTGGLAWIWDPENRFNIVANPDAIRWHRLFDVDAQHSKAFRDLVETHANLTQSRRAYDLLEDWQATVSATWFVVPKEIETSVLGAAKKVA
ncbi:MAG: hypothetical protein AAFQ67_05840, partial [Pseudomonadota bacterium]